MKEITVKGWNDLQERLYEGSWNEALGRFRSPLAYRGMQDAEFGLSTSLVRLGGEYERHEDDLLRNFRKYAHASTTPVLGDSVWHWLALGQHHGLPTRMLDWSYSPLVALHFATADLSDFILFAVNLDPHHTQSGWVHLPLEELGIETGQPFQVHDLLGGARYLWEGPVNYVELNPHAIPAHIFRVRHRVRTEQEFAYFV